MHHGLHQFIKVMPPAHPPKGGRPWGFLTAEPLPRTDPPEQRLASFAGSHHGCRLRGTPDPIPHLPGSFSRWRNLVLPFHHTAIAASATVSRTPHRNPCAESHHSGKLPQSSKDPHLTMVDHWLLSSSHAWRHSLVATRRPPGRPAGGLDRDGSPRWSESSSGGSGRELAMDEYSQWCSRRQRQILTFARMIIPQSPSSMEGFPHARVGTEPRWVVGRGTRRGKDCVLRRLEGRCFRPNGPGCSAGDGIAPSFGAAVVAPAVGIFPISHIRQRTGSGAKTDGKSPHATSSRRGPAPRARRPRWFRKQCQASPPGRAVDHETAIDTAARALPRHRGTGGGSGPPSPPRSRHSCDRRAADAARSHPATPRLQPGESVGPPALPGAGRLFQAGRGPWTVVSQTRTDPVLRPDGRSTASITSVPASQDVGIMPR